MRSQFGLVMSCHIWFLFHQFIRLQLFQSRARPKPSDPSIIRSRTTQPPQPVTTKNTWRTHNFDLYTVTARAPGRISPIQSLPCPVLSSKQRPRFDSAHKERLINDREMVQDTKVLALGFRFPKRLGLAQPWIGEEFNTSAHYSYREYRPAESFYEYVYR